MKFFPCWLVFLVMALPLCAQDWGTIETMEQVLAQDSITEDERIEAKLNLAEAYLHNFGGRLPTHTRLVKQHIESASLLAQQIGHEPGIVRSLYCMGYLMTKTRDYEQAELFFDSAYALAYPSQPAELAYINFGIGLMAKEQLQFERSITYLNQAIVQAHQAERWRLEALSHQTLGETYHLLHQRKLGNSHYKEAEKLWHLASANPYIPYLYWRIANSIGHHHYGKHFRYLDLAESLLEGRNDSTMKFYVYTQKMLNYLSLGNHDKFEEYYEKSKNNTTNLVHQYLNTANYGIYLRDAKHNYDSAIHYFQKAKPSAKACGKPNWAIDVYIELGTTEYTFGKPHRAIPHYRQAIALYGQYNTLFRRAETNIYLGECYLAVGDYDKAFNHLRAGLEYGIDDGVEWVAKATKGLAETHYHTQNFQQAYKYHQRYAQYNDSLSRVKDDFPVLKQSFFDSLNWQQDSLVLVAKASTRQTHEAAHRQQLLTFFWALGGVLGLGVIVTFGLLLRMKT